MKAVFSTVLSIVALAGAAQAQSVCMDAQELEAALIDWHGESPAGALQGDRQLWASEASGSWTLVIYRTGGQACVLDQGEDWDGAREPNRQMAALAD